MIHRQEQSVQTHFPLAIFRFTTSLRKKKNRFLNVFWTGRLKVIISKHKVINYRTWQFMTLFMSQCISMTPLNGSNAMLEWGRNWVSTLSVWLIYMRLSTICDSSSVSEIELSEEEQERKFKEDINISSLLVGFKCSWGKKMQQQMAVSNKETNVQSCCNKRKGWPSLALKKLVKAAEHFKEIKLIMYTTGRFYI